jgi:REP element-mobilizing transposase RayT
MARAARLKENGEGAANYHVTCRTNNRSFLFADGGVKDELEDSVRRSAEFSGVGLEAYSVLDNHLHVLCTVRRSGEKVPADEIVRRVGVLKGEKEAATLRERWDGLRRAGRFDELEAEADRYRARMNDLSEFVKTLKEHFDVRFKRRFRYSGSIWGGRFHSTMVEGGRYFEMCRRYIVLNPVRAGIVARAKDYAWSWAAEPAPCAGPVPADAAFGRRVAQFSAGKLFGSAAFVERWIAGFGDRLKARGVAAHPVGDFAFSSHGWLLAAREERKSA